MARRSAGSQGSAVAHVTAGTYNRVTIAADTLDWTSGAEWELTDLATNVAASGKDELYSWIRAKIYVCATGERCVYEYAVIKCASTDALQNLDDSPTVELLHKQHKVLARDIMMVPAPVNSSVKPVKFEFFNVQLNDGEELRLVIRPIATNTVDLGTYYGLLEWRKVGG